MRNGLSAARGGIRGTVLVGGVSCAVFLAYLLLALAWLLSSESTRTLLQAVIAAEAAHQVNREVAVGPLESDFLSHLTLRGVAVAGRGPLATDRFASALLIRVALDPLSLAIHPGQFVEIPRIVEIDRLRVWVVRDAQGDMALPGQGKRARKAAAAGLPGANILLRRAELSYTDHVLPGTGGEPVRMTYSGGIMVGDLGRLVSALQGGSPSPGLFSVQGRLMAQVDSQAVHTRVRAGWDGVTLTDLLAVTTAPQADSDAGNLDEVRLEQVEVGLAPERVLSDGQPPLQAITSVDIRGKRVHLTRMPDGMLSILRNVQEWLPESREPRKPVQARFPVTLRLERAAYTDLALAGVHRPLVVEGLDLAARVIPARLSSALEGKETGPAGELSGDFAARFGDLFATFGLSTDLLHSVWITDLAGVERGVSLVRGQRVLLAYDLPGIASGRKGVGVELVEADGLFADVTLDREYLPTFLPRLAAQDAPRPAETPQAVLPRVRLSNANLHVTLQAVRSGRDALSIHARGADADLSVGALARTDWLAACSASGMFEANLGDVSARASLWARPGAPLKMADLNLRHRGQEVLRARSGSVGLDWGGLNRDPGAAVRLIRAEGLVARVTRDRDGELALLKALPIPTTHGRKSSFGPRVQVTSGDITYLDLSRRSGVNWGRVQALKADVDLRKVALVSDGARARGVGTLSGSLRAGGPGVDVRASLRTDLDHSALVRNLQITEPGGRTPLALDYARLDFVPHLFLAGRSLEGVERAEVIGGRFDLLREPSGGLREERLISGKRKARSAAGLDVSDLRAFRPVLVLRDIQGRYRDVSEAGRPLTARVTDLGGTVNLGRNDRSRITGTLAAFTGGLSARAALSTNLWSELALTGLDAGEWVGKTWKRVAAASRVGLEYSLDKLLAGNTAQAIGTVSIKNGDFTVVREADGQLRVARLLGVEAEDSRNVGKPGSSIPHPRVSFTGTRVRYVDDSAPAGRVEIAGESLAGQLDLGRVLAATRREPVTGLGSVSGTVRLDSPRIAASAEIISSLDERITVSAFEAWEPAGSGERRLVSVPRGQVAYSLAALLGERPLEGLRKISLDRADVTVARLESGELELVEMLRGVFGPGEDRDGAGTDGVRDPGNLVAALTVRRGRVVYVDHHVTREAEPLWLEVLDLDGDVPAGQIAALMQRKEPERPGVLRASVRASWPGATASGSLSTDVRSFAHLRDLDVQGVDEGEPGARAGLLVAEYDLGKLLGEGDSWPSGIRSVRADGLVAHVTRDARGRTDVAGLLGTLMPDTGEPAETDTRALLERLDGQLLLSQSDITYTDHALNSRGPVSVRLVANTANVRLDRLAAATRSQDAQGAGSFDGSFSVRLPGGELRSNLRTTDIARGFSAREPWVRAMGEREPTFEADWITATYVLEGFFAEDRPFQEAIRSVDLDAPALWLERLPDGRLDLLASLASGFETDPATPDGTQAPARTARDELESLHARVQVSQARGAFVDHQVSAGPVELAIERLDASLDTGNLWASIRQEYTGDIGWVRLRARASNPGERVVLDADWRLDGEIDIRDASVIQTGLPLPVLTTHAAHVKYEPSTAFGRNASIPASILDIRVDRAFTQARRLETGRLELPRLVQAYLPAESQPAPARASGETEFLGGFSARVRVGSLSALYEDLCVGDTPASGTISSVSADLDFARIAALRRGERVESPGTVRGCALLGREETCLRTSLAADLGGRLFLDDLSLLSHSGRRHVLTAKRLCADFDPVQVLSGDEPLEGITRIVAQSASADVLIGLDGRWELAHLLDGIITPEAQAEAEAGLEHEHLLATVALLDSTFKYLDLRQGPQRPDLRRLEARDLNGSIVLADLWEATRTGVGMAAGSLEGTLDADWRDLRLSAGVDTDLNSFARVRDASVISFAEDAPRELVSLKDGQFQGMLAQIIAGAPPESSIHRVAFAGLRADVLRNADGTFEIARLSGLEPAGAEETASDAARRLTGVLQLDDSTVRYRDQTLEEPLSVELSELAGTVDLASVGRLIDAEPAADAGEIVGSVSGSWGLHTLRARLSTDVLGRAELRDVSLRVPGEETPITAGILVARYDLNAIIRGEKPLSHVQSLTAERLVARAVRRADGTWNLLDQIPSLEPADDGEAGEQDLGTLLARVRAGDCDLEFVDHTVQGPDPLTVRARDLDADLDLAALEAMRQDGVTRPGGSLHTRFAATMTGLAASGEVTADLSGGLDVTNLSLRGSGDGVGDVFQAPRLGLRFETGPILAGQPAVEHVGKAELEEPAGRLTREADGRLQLVRLVSEGLWASESSPESAGESGKPQGRVSAQNPRIQYVDHALYQDGPLVATLSGPGFDLDLSDPENPRGPVNLAVHLRTRTEQVSARIGGEISERIMVRDLSVLQPPQGEVLHVDRMDVYGRLASVSGDAADLLARIRRVDIGGARGNFRRDRAGTITSPLFVGERPGGSSDQDAALTGRFDTWLTLDDVSLALDDEGLLGPNAPLARLEIGPVVGSVLVRGELRGDGASFEPQGGLTSPVRLASGGTSVSAEVETDLLERVWVRNLESVSESGHQHAWVGQIAARYDLHDLLSSRPLYEAITGLDVHDAQFDVGADPDGTLRLAGLPVTGAQIGSAGAATSAGTVELEGQASTDADGLIRGDLTAGGGNLLDGVRAAFVFDPSDLWIDADFDAGRVDLPLLGQLVLAREDGRALAGEASGSGFAYGQLGKDGEGVTWSVAGRLQGAQVVIPRLGTTPVEAAFPFVASSEGLRVERADIRWSGVTGRVQGSVFDLRDPLLALEVQAQAPRGEDLLALLPESARQRFAGLSLTDRAVVTASVTGPAKDAVADVRLSSPGAALAELQGLGSLKFEGIDLTASVVGWRSPSVRAVAAVDRSSLSVAPGLSDPVSAALETVEIGPAGARFLSGSGELGDATVSVPWASIQGVPLTDLQATAHLVGETVQIAGVRAALLEGELAGAGRVELSETGGLTFSGRAMLSDAELSGLHAMRSWPAELELAGTAQVLAGVETTADSLDYGADITLDTPAINQGEFDSGRLLVSGDASGTRLEMASLDRGDAHVWARGEWRTPPGDGDVSPRVKLDVAGTGVDPSMLPVDLGERRLSGSAYFTGHAWGDPRDPDLDLWLQVFDPAVDDAQFDAAAAHLTRSGSEARIDHLVACRGASVFGVRDLKLNQVLLYDSRGRFRPAAYIQGGLVGLYAGASDIAPLTGRELNTGGWVHLNGAISGPARRPTVNALVGADHLQLGEFFVDEVRLPISVTGDEVIISDGTARAHGGHLSVLGRVSDLYGESRYEVVAALDHLALEDLPPVHRLGLDVDGMASIPQFTAWGSRHHPATGGATFRASNVRVRTEMLEPVTGWIGFGNGLIDVSARRIRKVRQAPVRGVQAAEPVTVSAQATLETATRMLRAQVRVGAPPSVYEADETSAAAIRALPDIGSLLLLAAPLVAIGETSREQPSPPAFGATDEPAAPASASQTLAQIGLRASGKVAGQLLLVGPLEELNCRTRLSVWDAELDQKPLPRRISAQFGADLKGRRVYDIEADATDGRQFCMVSGSLTLPDPAFEGWAEADDPASCDLSVEGADVDLPMWRDWVPSELPFGGSATFLLTAGGRTRSPTIRGSLDIMKPTVAGAQFDVLKLPLIDVREGAIKVRRARLIRSDEVPAARKGEAPTRALRELAMEGTVPWTWSKPWVPPDQDMDFRAELADIDLGFFLRLLDEAAREQAPVDRRGEPTVWSRLETSGTVSANLNVTGPWGAPQLTGRMRVKDGSVQAAGWKRPVDDLQLDVSLARKDGRNLGTVEEARGRWGTVNWKSKSAWAYLDHLKPADLVRNEYHMDVDLNADKSTSIAGITVSRLGGGLSLHTDAAPETGLAQGPRNHRLTANDLTAWLPEGSIRLAGSSNLTTFLPTELASNSYDMKVVFDGAYLQRGKQFRGVVDGTVSATAMPDGTATADAPLMISGDLVVRQAEVGLVIPKASSGSREILGLSRRYPTPVFNVRVNAAEAVRLKGLGITIPVEPSTVAHLTGSLHRPSLVGHVAADSGGIRVPGGGLNVTSARIDYEFGPKPGYLGRDRLPLELRGEVNAEARQSITDADVPGWGSGDVEVVLLVHGNLPDDIRVDTRSEPPLSDQQILALIGSEQLSGLEIGGRGKGLEEILAEQTLNLLAAGFRARVFDPIESEIKRILGLSEFNVTFGFNQSVDIRLGKYLLKDLLVSYESGVGGDDGDGYEASVSYRLKNRLRVAYTTDERGDDRIKLSYDTDF